MTYPLSHSCYYFFYKVLLFYCFHRFPVLSSSNIDGYGFARSDSFDNEEFDKFMATYLSVMARRAMKWSTLVGKRTKIAKSATGMASSFSSKFFLAHLFSFECFHFS